MKKFEVQALRKLIPIFFLIIFVEITILKLKDEISLISLLEALSALLLIVLYYFLIREEFKMASKEIETNLTEVTNKLDSIEDDLKEEIKTLEKEVKELKIILKKK